MSKREHNHAEVDARRVELGRDTFLLRPPTPASRTLDGVAAKLGVSRSLAAAYAFQRAADELTGMSRRELEAAIAMANELEEKRG